MLGKKSHHCVAYERNYFVFCELKILVNWIEMTLQPRLQKHSNVRTKKKTERTKKKGRGCT